MKELLLNNSKDFSIVDDDVYEKIKNITWYKDAKGYVVYKKYKGKLNGKYVSETIYLHRFVLDFPFKLQVDHIDMNKLNNQKINLRACTNQQNNRNTKSKKNSSSKYKGVSWDSKNKKWISQICLGQNKHKKLGRFTNEEDAARKYDEAAKLYHGEYCYLNFPL